MIGEYAQPAGALGHAARHGGFFRQKTACPVVCIQPHRRKNRHICPPALNFFNHTLAAGLLPAGKNAASHQHHCTVVFFIFIPFTQNNGRAQAVGNNGKPRHGAEFLGQSRCCGACVHKNRLPLLQLQHRGAGNGAFFPFQPGSTLFERRFGSRGIQCHKPAVHTPCRALVFQLDNIPAGSFPGNSQLLDEPLCADMAVDCYEGKYAVQAGFAQHVFQPC